MPNSLSQCSDQSSSDFGHEESLSLSMVPCSCSEDEYINQECILLQKLSVLLILGIYSCEFNACVQQLEYAHIHSCFHSNSLYLFPDKTCPPFNFMSSLILLVNSPLNRFNAQETSYRRSKKDGRSQRKGRAAMTYDTLGMTWVLWFEFLM